MPRISRSTTMFDVGGRTYLAMFGHRHQERGKKHTLEWEKEEQKISVQHITTCRLFEQTLLGSGGKHTKMLAEASAGCSNKDHYNWRKGLRLSFLRVLEKIGVDKSQFMPALFQEINKKSN